MQNVDNLAWLQNYYLSLCDGDWEHTFGFNIETSDNPGWIVSFDLQETELEGTQFDLVEIKRSKQDWFFCSVDNNRFSASGGPKNLDEILAVFRKWVEQTEAKIVS
jgi:hypothetical protein